MSPTDILLSLKALVVKKQDVSDPHEKGKKQDPLRESVLVAGYDTYISQAYSWRLIAMQEACALIVAVFALVYIGCQNRFIPYVITLGSNGDSYTVHEAQKASMVDESFVFSNIKQFIIKSRSIVSDPVIQKDNLNEIVYPRLTGQAHSYINDWYQLEEYQPFARMEKGTVDVQVNSIVSSGDAYEVTWTETARNRVGKVQSTGIWKATIGISFFPLEGVPSRLNPLGFYITTLHWTQRL
jgi:type IV secretion system protein TrbF